MQLANLPREADATGALVTDFHIDTDPPVTRRLIPHTLSRHAAARPFNRQPLVLAGRDATAARLKAVVGRARGKSTTHPLRRSPVPQPAMPRLAALCDAAEDRARGVLDRMIVLAIGGLAVWVGGPVLLTMVAGTL
ncbi:hypothetical protein [Sphingomonas sp. RIT328]|uniref:hypothetical protein n=1 Tax=Sphingomonas sp. RIT328 TaxID=1470591 RepID=UPI00044C5236|nr:hypothetical protein [Sphingomonas sp. RIT328]EZP57456.1 hypothetical protein BW41_00301 [Sphingomonas sp. RIT328]